MTRCLEFAPAIEPLAEVRATWPIEALVEEVSVYAASPEFVRRECGPVANAILDAVPAHYFERCRELDLLPNIDFRVHRLNVGEFPAVPGWHCDGVKRETYFGQPDVAKIRVRDTVLCAVSTGDVCGPEILTERLEVDVPDAAGEDWALWRHVHGQVPSDHPRMALEDGRMVQIGSETLHRVMPARRRGVRALFRMSMWHNDYLGDGGKVARQQQVYVLNEANGW